ncbi:Type I restriction-modification system, specificity subunit S [Vibrio chagasii]|nr:Type I restriction-modification system, specificity subunit S [Vibrio chagasii]CAH6960237.1 Type I restriction-modification system, specificity subunit S [Vibrio chagasii]CAH6962057.1 Type I restriction-modification system, specificity subunit S [Vibrio chagasii]CAH7157764.1 Type I restriction-modification system, specificity subunit S [Vibrio chagasii]CAH7298196.1 Type I restriction-modification system, specificity subunit S [Vibrio chagasii]
MNSSWTTEDLDSNITFIDYRGRTPKKVSSGVRLITAKNVKFGFIQKDPEEFISPADLDSWMTRGIPRVGDVFFTTEAPLGNVAQLDSDEPIALGQRIITLQPDRNVINQTFLKYFLLESSTQSAINRVATGATVKGIKAKLFKKIQISYPSIAEQENIVTLLDKAFADIDQARLNTEKNLRNARELFDSYLQQMFSECGEGWKKFVFSDLCEITSKLVDPRESEFLDYPHIGAANITSVTGELTEIKTAREEQLKSGKFVFDESMVLYSKIRPYLMKTCRPNFVGLCSADIYPLVPNKELITRDFLFYLLTTQHFTDYAISGSSRAGMPKVNRTHLFNYTCHIPSVEEQEMLVEKLNLMMEKSEELQGIYQSKLAALGELKQSLLQQAFTGQLTQG